MDQKLSKCCKVEAKTTSGYYCTKCKKDCEVKDQPAPESDPEQDMCIDDEGGFDRQPAPTEFDWDNFRKELGEELGYVTSLFMSQEKKGTEIVMPTEELRETIDRILLYLHPLKSRTVPLAEYQALEAQLAAAQEKIAKVEEWAHRFCLFGAQENLSDLNQILHPEK